MTERHAAPRRAGFGLGGWAYYFIAKLVLVWQGLIGLHLPENLALAAALALPLAARWRVPRHLAALPCAAGLLYYDSFLPPAAALWAQGSLNGSVNAAYLVQLGQHLIQWPVLALLVLACFAGRVVGSFLRLGVLVVAGLCLTGLLSTRQATAVMTAQQGGAAELPEAVLHSFYETEGRRSVGFDALPANAVPFDLIFLQVAALSWDDVRAAGLDRHAVWRKADFLFHRFNSVASYSGPAAVRLLRAPCGQQPHRALFEPVGAPCYLMPQLEQLGFLPQFALNHDGHAGGLRALVRKQGLDAAPLPLDGLAAPMRTFDDSAVHEDGAVLARWLAARMQDQAPHVALYYHTVSLQDGNRTAGGAGNRASYRQRAARLLDDIEGFMQALERSGRRAVVFLVPAYGAALRGDKMQWPGLRAIGTPEITTVPLAARVVGAGALPLGGMAQVNEATSYLALSHLAAVLVAKPPFGSGGFTPAEYLAELPLTAYVTQNEGIDMMALRGRFLLRMGNGPWQAYQAPPDSAGGARSTTMKNSGL